MFISELLSSTAIAAEPVLFEPFSTSSMNPFTRLHGLPTARSAYIAPPKSVSTKLQVELANNFTNDSSGSETIVIDGETWRGNLVLGYAISDRWEVGAEIPLVRHTGGSLDNFIERWHDIFGLPQSGRDDIKQDLLRYQYTSATSAPVRLTSNASGIGDITLTAAWLLNSDPGSSKPQITLRGGIKLPTGDADKLLGSGGTDVHLGVYLGKQKFLGRESLYLNSHIGVIALGDNDLLSDRVEDWAVYGGSSLVWLANARISLKAQFDFHTAVYDSRLKQLGETSGLLSVGGTIMLSPKTRLDLSVGEDIITDTTPDVVIQFGLHRDF